MTATATKKPSTKEKAPVKATARKPRQTRRKVAPKKTKPVRKLSPKFTLEDAAKELQAKQEAAQVDRDARLKQASYMVAQALQMTDCSLRVNPDSPLKALQIIVVSNT